MNRKEMLHQYRLHITVSIIFLAALLLVTSGWYFKDKVRKETLRNQKIFIDPKARVLSLTQQADGKQVGTFILFNWFSYAIYPKSFRQKTYNSFKIINHVIEKIQY